MKKILSIAVAVLMVCALSVSVFAEWTANIDMTADNLAQANGAVENDEGLFIESGNQFSIKLPADIVEGDTVTIHVTGHSAGDFRMWLYNPNGESTCSDIYKMSDNGFTTGDFDVTFELAFWDKDGKGVTVANALNFKAPSYDGALDNLTITSLSVTFPGEEPAVEETPAEETPAEETPAEEAPAETGIVLCLLPMAVAAAAVVISKRR